MKLLITNIDGRKFTLVDENEKEYRFYLKFFGLEKDLVPGDILYFDARLCDKSYVEYSREYYFGPLDEPYGRKIQDETSPDLIVVESNGERVFLKRFFG